MYTSHTGAFLTRAAMRRGVRWIPFLIDRFGVLTPLGIGLLNHMAEFGGCNAASVC